MNPAEQAKSLLSRHYMVLMHHFPESDSYQKFTAAKKCALLEAGSLSVFDPFYKEVEAELKKSQIAPINYLERH